jgi:putative ABC transport system permease protein
VRIRDGDTRTTLGHAGLYSPISTCAIPLGFASKKEMLTLPANLSQAFRSLRRSPVLAAIAVSSLALGIGANVTIYSIVREMVLDDLSARQPDRLARMAADVPYARYRELRQAGIFQDLAFNLWFTDINWNSGTHGEIAWQMVTSANFFDVLGVDASAGRLYNQGDEGHPVAVVSYGFWRRRLSADAHIVGRVLKLNGKLFTVTGVLPRDYRSIVGRGVSPEIYVIAPPDSAHCHSFGRLRDGLTRNQTQQALLAAARNIGAEEFARRISVLRPMAGLAVQAAAEGDDRRFFIFFLMLFGTAVALSLIACLNVAGLLLSRGVARQRELAIRKALGAGRWHIIRQQLTEGTVLVALGLAGGLALDAFLRHQLSYIRWPSAYDLPFELHFQNNSGLFLYAIAAAFAMLLLSSLLPAVRGAGADLGLVMKQSEPAFSIRRWNLRNSFVALQLALSVVLLSLGLLFVRSFVRLANADPGFNISGTVIVRAHQPPGAAQGEAGWVWRDHVAELLTQVPGVTAVTSIGTLPLMGELQSQDSVSRPRDPLSTVRDAYELGGGEQFCRVLGIPILRGRDFERADRTRRPVPVLLNQTLAGRLFGAANPIGQEILVGREKPRAFEVVGLAADAKLRTLGEDHPAVFFTPFSFAQLLVATAGDGARWIQPLRNALAQLDSDAAVDVRPLTDAAAGALFPMRVAAAFGSSLAGIGLVLVLTGLYGSVSYATRRRTRELAIRAAVGATRSRIVWTAISDGMAVLTCGVLLGLPLAIAAIRPLTGIIPDGVNPWSIPMFVSVVLVLPAVGTGAAWIPARQAAKIDLSSALRQE